MQENRRFAVGAGFRATGDLRGAVRGVAGDGTNTATYAYLANSPLIDNVVFKQNGTVRLTRTNQFDLLNRLTNLVWTAGGQVVASFAYQYNDANQRTRATLADGSYWVYQYDALGQVSSAKRYWSNGTLVAGQQGEYSFDDIGNRKWARTGGGVTGTGLRRFNYSANTLNQYTSRNAFPGSTRYADVLGEGTNTATVTVNLLPTTRFGDYFRAELAVTNTGAVWLGVTNIAVLNQGTNADLIATNIGNLFVPATPESFAYDLDGNVTNDGRWSYGWDAENRATSFTRGSDAPSPSRVKVECGYDYRWRRTQKVVSTWNGSAYQPASTNKFLYDGWNLVAVLDHTNGMVQSFVWGSDASGSLQGAGGVGGLLSMTVHQGTNAGTYFYCFDGNGNVAALVSAANGMVAARYEYDSFGQVLRATGPLAFVNPFTFSTKFCDWETGFYYYGYRYYDPSAGRWLGREPLGELASRNLFEFANNDPLSFFDLNGLDVGSGKGGASGLMNNPNPAFPGLHLTPIGVIRLIGGLPFSIASGDFFTSKVQPVPAGKGKCRALVTVNGILTGRRGSLNLLNSVSGAFRERGYVFDYSYAAYNTTTWLGDPVQVLGDEAWMVQSASLALASQLNQLHRQFKANGCCEAQIVVVGYSQGTKVFKQATSYLDPETKAIISYYGVAGQAQVRDDDLAQVQNNTNIHDGVPFFETLNPLNWGDWAVNGFPKVSSTDGPFLGHGFWNAFGINSHWTPPFMVPLGN